MLRENAANIIPGYLRGNLEKRVQQTDGRIIIGQQAAIRLKLVLVPPLCGLHESFVLDLYEQLHKKASNRRRCNGSIVCSDLAQQFYR